MAPRRVGCFGPHRHRRQSGEEGRSRLPPAVRAGAPLTRGSARRTPAECHGRSRCRALSRWSRWTGWRTKGGGGR